MQVSGYALTRIHLPGTWVNKGKKQGRSLPREEDPGPAFCLGCVLPAYLEFPHLLLTTLLARVLVQCVACQVLGPGSDYRLVVGTTPQVVPRVEGRRLGVRVVGDVGWILSVEPFP